MKKHPAWQPYIDAKLGLANFWYPAVYGEELAEGGFGGVQMLGERMLLAPSEGRVYAVADQCAIKAPDFPDGRNATRQVPSPASITASRTTWPPAG